MFKKFGIGMLAVTLAVAFSAFTTVKKSTPATGYSPMLYWYEVVNNVIPKDAQPYAHAEASNVESFCDQTALEIDCLRGFEEVQDTSEGALTATGEEQIKRDDPNTP